MCRMEDDARVSLTSSDLSQVSLFKSQADPSTVTNGPTNKDDAGA